MKKNKIILAAFFAFSVFMQIFYFANREQLYEFGFAAGIKEELKSDLGVTLMYLIVPLIFIVFMVSGSMHNLTHGYGKVLIIRNYSKTKLFLKNRLKCTVAAAGITVFQALAYIPFNSTMLSFRGSFLQVFLMYFIVLNLIIALQGILELLIAPHIANIILFIYSYISCYLVQMLSLNPLLRVLLFPCLLFGTLNSSAVFDGTYFLYLISSIVSYIIFIFIGILKFKRTDIF